MRRLHARLRPHIAVRQRLHVADGEETDGHPCRYGR